MCFEKNGERPCSPIATCQLFSSFYVHIFDTTVGLFDFPSSVMSIALKCTSNRMTLTQPIPE